MLPAYPPKTSGMAIASLVLGLTSIVATSCCCGTGFLPAVLAVVFGHVAQHQIKRSQGRLEGSALAVAGLVCGYIGLVFQVFLALLTLVLCIVSAVAEHHHARVNVQRW
jgi:hypothetical protein